MGRCGHQSASQTASHTAQPCTQSNAWAPFREIKSGTWHTRHAAPSCETMVRHEFCSTTLSHEHKPDAAARSERSSQRAVSEQSAQMDCWGVQYQSVKESAVSTCQPSPHQRASRPPPRPPVSSASSPSSDDPPRGFTGTRHSPGEWRTARSNLCACICVKRGMRRLHVGRNGGLGGAAGKRRQQAAEWRCGLTARI